MTANVSQEEQERVAHHLVKFLDPRVVDFDVRSFRKMALEKIEEIHG